MNTFSNTGNIPTLHQLTVTVTTVTHTHWLPTQWLIHITCLKFGSVLAGSTHTYYVLQDIAKCSGCEDCECTRNCISGYAHIYRVLLLHHPHFLCFSILCSQAAQMCGICHGVWGGITTKLGVSTQYILRTKCCAPAIVMHWQLTSHLPIFSVVDKQCTAKCVCVFLQFSGMGFLHSTPNLLKHGVHRSSRSVL